MLSLAVVAFLLLASPPPGAVAAPPPPRILAGAYKQVHSHHPEVQEALAFIRKDPAAFHIQSLDHLHDARIQVVAGTHIKLHCRVRLPDGEGPRDWEIMLWHKLDRTWVIKYSGAKAELSAQAR